MVVMDLADEGHQATAGGTAHVPPLVPMVMQLINEYAEHTVELPCTDPLLLAMPGWHQKGRVLADEIDNSQNINMPNQMSRVRHLQLQVAKHPKRASLVPQSVRNMVTTLECECWPIDTRIVLSLRKLTDFTLRLFDDEGDHSHDTNDDTVIDWLPSISTLENVDVYGDYVTKFFTDTSLRGLETLPSLKSVYLLQCDLSSLNALSRAAALTSIFVQSDSLTSSCIEDLWRCPALQRVGLLNCSNLVDISALAKCRTLNELCLAGAFCTHPSVVDVCRNVPTLTSLRLSTIDHAAALAIAAMPSLKLRLVSSSLDPPDLAFDLLKLTLPCLEELQLKCCDGVIVWSTCRHLTNLTVTEANSIDLSSLAALPTLTNLKLGDLCNTVTWAGSLRDSKSLARFVAYQDDLLEDLHHIPTLTEIQCWVQSDRTLERVNACSRLKVLWVSGVLVTNERLAALHDLAYIQEIFLSMCGNVTNVDVLLEPTFPSLQRISFYRTAILDEDAYSARLSVRLARRQLHTSWFLRDEDDAAEP